MNNIPFLEKVRIQLLFGGIYELIKKSNRNIHDLLVGYTDISHIRMIFKNIIVNRRKIKWEKF